MIAVALLVAGVVALVAVGVGCLWFAFVLHRIERDQRVSPGWIADLRRGWGIRR